MTPISRAMWTTSTLAQLADYLERECQPRTRAALEAVQSRLGRSSELAELDAALDARIRELSELLLPRIRALELARCGRGPWPNPNNGSLRPRIASLRAKSAEIIAFLDALLASGANRDATALARLARTLKHQIDVEHALVQRAVILEPERRHAPRDGEPEHKPGDFLSSSDARLGTK